MEQEKDSEMASFLHVISELGEQLSVELYTPAEAAEQVPELDTAYLPVTGLYKNGEYRRVTFHGVPGGKEINSFVLAVLNLSGGGQEVPEKLKKTHWQAEEKKQISRSVCPCHAITARRW
uniref:hypothetical protein n=1 Tax=Clostridium sp. NkU-1 TaxID=1095009 RepID=UPI003260D0CB